MECFEKHSFHSPVIGEEEKLSVIETVAKQATCENMWKTTKIWNLLTLKKAASSQRPEAALHIDMRLVDFT